MVMTPAGILQPMTTFPNYLKTKTTYFIRRCDDPVTINNFRDILVFGDFSGRPVTELSILTDEIFIPLLTNIKNHIGWPQVISQDVINHIEAFKNIVYQVSTVHGKVFEFTRKHFDVKCSICM